MTTIQEPKMNKLPKRLVEHLVKLPETGMGYQHAIFILDDGERVDGIVYNCELTEFDRVDEISYIIVLSK